MRFPSVELDGWYLESGEENHARSPDTYWIPPAEERRALRVGQVAKMAFYIELDEADGSVSAEVERMWVIVSEVHADYYIGLLANVPDCLIPSDDIYLVEGAEIPFQPENVINIDTPTDEFIKGWLSEPPTRPWPRTTQ